MKKLIIFDLDGTLLNTIADLAHSTNHALQTLGYPTHEVASYNFMVGNGINKLFERALPKYSNKPDSWEIMCYQLLGGCLIFIGSHGQFITFLLLFHKLKIFSLKKELFGLILFFR